MFLLQQIRAEQQSGQHGKFPGGHSESLLLSFSQQFVITLAVRIWTPMGYRRPTGTTCLWVFWVVKYLRTCLFCLFRIHVRAGGKILLSSLSDPLSQAKKCALILCWMLAMAAMFACLLQISITWEIHPVINHRLEGAVCRSSLTQI